MTDAPPRPDDDRDTEEHDTISPDVTPPQRTPAPQRAPRRDDDEGSSYLEELAERRMYDRRYDPADDDREADRYERAIHRGFGE